MRKARLFFAAAGGDFPFAGTKTVCDPYIKECRLSSLEPVGVLCPDVVSEKRGRHSFFMRCRWDKTVLNV